jgi:hypothetical protein
VVALWRYPVKSMQGEALQIAQVRDHGLLGDRAYALLDRANSMVTSNRPTLYERLGGVYRIATVVDDLIDWVMDDPRLNANPRVDEAHHRFSAAGFKYLVTEMVCWVSGGPSSLADARCGSRTKISG